MKHCAFLTLDDPTGFVIDDELAHEPLAELGWRVSWPSWRQTDIPWSDFDAVIIRSPWDYPAHSEEFLCVLESIDASGTRLANPLSVVRWNLNKTYLGELERAGVPIVPTLWEENLKTGDFVRFSKALDTDELVIKPVVGANGEDVFRVAIDSELRDLQQVVDAHDGQAFMVQPFMRPIVDEGEYSLFFFNGEYSHAILKTPAQGEFRSQEERGSSLAAVKPEARLMKHSRHAMEVVMGRGEGTRDGSSTGLLSPEGENRPASDACAAPTIGGGDAGPPLYARVDLVRDGSGDFRVMEVELIEPALYLRMDPGAPMRFARAVDEWYRSG